MPKSSSKKTKTQPRNEKNLETLNNRLKNIKKHQDVVLATACTVFCDDNSFLSNPWEWASANAVLRFYIRDRQFCHRFAISPAHARIVQWIAVIFCFIMFLVWGSPQKFEKIFSPLFLSVFGVATSVLAQYVFVDFTLIQMSALVMISCYTLVPKIANGENSVVKQLEKIRTTFFPRSVSRSAYFIFSVALAVLLPILFPIGSYSCILIGRSCSAFTQWTIVLINIIVLLVLTIVFGLPVARFTNEDPKSQSLQIFIKKTAAIFDIFEPDAANGKAKAE